MKRFWFLPLFLLPILLMLTGCANDDVGIAQRAVVQRFGIDWDEEKGFAVSMYIITPDKLSPAGGGGGGGGGGEESGQPESDKPESNGKDKLISYGKTLYDAIKNFENVLQLKPYFSHAEALVIGDSVSKESLNLITDIFDRNNDFRPSLSIFCTNGKASDIVLLGDDKPSASDRAETVAQLGNDNAQMSSTFLYKVIDLLRDGAQDLFIPVLSTEKHGKQDILVVNGTALFRGDKLVDYISPEETRNLLFAKDLVSHADVVIENEELGLVSLSTTKSQTKITAELDENNKLFFKVKIDSALSVEEIVNTKGVVLHENHYQGIQDAYNKQIEEQVSALIHKMIFEYDVDTIGFSNLLWAQKPKVWKSITGGDVKKREWLQEVPIYVECHSKVTDVGLAAQKR
ncbi:Ger(x)C family spore germination protein [Candidatus Soleaferrea massiliensis]|uniref:Ger(x)C family spore germination protein n=1 Tax=Candidatus Soleaferrea massiliensis TaxID=1470354 RepID=UPI00058EECB2|nr:Ger(x)C family spore germination protein [Candidatus Soleaferrea massiliensis]